MGGRIGTGMSTYIWGRKDVDEKTVKLWGKETKT